MKEVNDSLSHLDGDETIDTLQEAMTLIDTPSEQD